MVGVFIRFANIQVYDSVSSEIKMGSRRYNGDVKNTNFTNYDS